MHTYDDQIERAYLVSGHGDVSVAPPAPALPIRSVAGQAKAVGKAEKAKGHKAREEHFRCTVEVKVSKSEQFSTSRYLSIS